ncbi:MAG: DUF58 domain-containing protein [Rhodocyclaceae bacterium]|nr:DUF58 domain-containing protein [Rhodocyclaceae bacterium]
MSRLAAAPAGAFRRLLDRHLFRLREHEALPATLRQRRIFILPTATGVAFAVTLCVLLLASINYTLSLGFALTFLLAGAAIASIFHAFRNLLRLEIHRGAIHHAHCGEAAHVELLLRSPDQRARPAIAVRIAGKQALLDVPAGGEACARLALATTRRGWLSPGRVIIETRYPLGLIRAWSVLTPEWRVLVYPALETAPPPPPHSAHDHDGGSAGGEADFDGLREHRRSDSPKRVAWKAVARTDEMVSKAFSGGGAMPTVFDWHTLPAALDDEARLRRLTRWVVDAAHGSQPFTLILPGLTLGPDHSAAHQRACLKALALFPARP